MQRTNGRYLRLLLLVLFLSLVVTVSGLAQSATPTAPDAEEAVPPTPVSAEVTEEITVTAVSGVTATLAVTPQAGLEISEPVTVAVPLLVTADIEVTEPMTVSEVLEEVAAVIPSEPPVPTLYTVTQGVELTVYNEDLGLVKEVRELDLQAGRNVFRFVDVPSRIDPTTVQVGSLSQPQGLMVLEQDYEFDLVSSHSLLRRYVDQEIRLVTKGGSAYSGTLLSGDDDLIMATRQGVTIIVRDQVQEIILPTLPEGLITRPTLVWMLQAAEQGPQDVQVTYLTGGLGWQADYNLLFAPETEQLSMTGWVTLRNTSGATYRDAKLKLVAGDLNRVSAVVPQLMLEKAAVRVAAGEPAVEERSFFEYHLYQIQRPVTVRDRQTKQIEFVSASAITASKVFVYEASPRAFVSRGGVVSDPNYGSLPEAAVRVELEFENETLSGLGFALPAGIMRVYQQDVDGGAELVGEDRIEHTPRGESVALYLGDAFDVVGEHVQTAFSQLGERGIEESYEVTLRNHKDEDIEVRVLEHLFRAQDATVVSSSMDYERVDATTLAYRVPVAADAASVISYTVRYEW